MNPDRWIERLNAFEQAVVGWFNGWKSFVRVLIWAVVWFGVVITAADRYEERVETERVRMMTDTRDEAIKDRDSRRYRLAPQSVAAYHDTKREDQFRIVLIGSSENFFLEQREDGLHMDLDISLGSELENELSSDQQPYPVVIDSSYPGTYFGDKYRLIDYATQLDPDLIVMTTDYFKFQETVPVPKVQRAFQPMETLYDSVVRMAAFSPGEVVHDQLSEYFKSVAGGFRSSIRPLLVSGSEIAFEGFQLDKEAAAAEEQKLGLGRFADRNLTVDPDQVTPEFDIIDYRRLAQKSMNSYGEVLEAITSLATVKGIPVLVVVTPTNDIYRDQLPERFQNFIADVDAYEASKTADSPPIYVWNSVAERLVPSEKFTDNIHYKDFRLVATRLAEVMYEKGLVPREWAKND